MAERNQIDVKIQDAMNAWMEVIWKGLEFSGWALSWSSTPYLTVSLG